jgi:type VI protein secretion system component VasF
MSQKRKHADLADGHDDAQKSSRKKHFRTGNTHPHPKGKRLHQSNAEPKPNATNALKSRVRDLRRLLEKLDNDPKYKMPANIRMERERELEATEHKLAEKTAAAREAELRKKMIGKYHQVRFFGG